MEIISSDELAIIGFLDKEKILSYISEEEIFELIFKFKPKEYQYVCSPFRVDTNPGCWFERSLSNNRLIFIDYADSFFNKQDCFGCVKRFYKLPNFYQTLLFIKEVLIDNKEVKKSLERRVFIPQKKKAVEIYIKPRNFIQSDKTFWFKYGITRKQLSEDKVIPIGRFTIVGSRAGDITSTVYTNCYAYTEFDNNRKKLYSPYKKGSGRFITNCNQDDIGSVIHLKKSTQVVITKSYKDCRVLRNEGVNCIWFQNEGMIPKDELLLSVLSPYKDIVVFFDNDETGFTATQKVILKLQSLHLKVRCISLPEKLHEKGIKDASDMYCLKGRESLIKFLKVNHIKYENRIGFELEANIK